MADLSGQQLGQYTLISKLGEGGMAAVYRAHQTSVNRDIAIKVIESRLASSPEFVHRFEREAQTIASLDHPHILKVFDFGRQGDLLYLVMDIKTGGSLSTLIRGGLSLDYALRLMQQIAEALDYAHEQGIIHRDLKPQNVLLDTRGNGFLTDFGIAKAIQGETTALTHSGMVMGTPAYMAPEQWQNRGIDARVDLYAFGIMIYEMLTGQVPFQADTPFQLMHAHIYEAPRPVRTLRPDYPPAVESVITQMLAKDPNQRFPTAQAMVAALRYALSNQLFTGEMSVSGALPLAPSTPARRFPLPLILGGLTLLIVLVGVVILLASRSGGSAANLPAPASDTAIAVLPTLTPSTTPTLLPDLLTLTKQAVELTSLADVMTRETDRRATAANMTQTAQRIAETKLANQNTREAAQATILALSYTPTATPTHTATATATPTSTWTPTATATLTETALATISANQRWTSLSKSFDGVEMMLVPPGCFKMGSTTGAEDERPVTKICFDKPFWIDKTEVTQADFKRLDGLASFGSGFTGDLRPVEQISWFEAADYCLSRNGRLPTEAEWEYAARGPDGLEYPWGDTYVAENVARSETTDKQTAEVGTLPAGASWVGALDMSGNVWEWVNSLYRPYPYRAEDGREDPDNASGARVARGGSWFYSYTSEFRAASRHSDSPNARFHNYGFRCARSFEATNVASTAVPVLSLNHEWKPVVRRFDGVDMVQVPAGCFWMGSTGEQARQARAAWVRGGASENDANGWASVEIPRTKICFDKPFWIDKTEVTQAQFKQLGGIAANTPGYLGDERPVESITWLEARNFCEKRGAQLPTEAEWEYAARGPDDWLYPWGDTFDAAKVILNRSDGTAPVGSVQDGASWVGALDMAGNVWEWTNTALQFYPYIANDGRENSTDLKSRRVLRGGSWFSAGAVSVRTTHRTYGEPDTFSSDHGFRCARSDESPTTVTPTAGAGLLLTSFVGVPAVEVAFVPEAIYNRGFNRRRDFGKT